MKQQPSYKILSAVMPHTDCGVVFNTYWWVSRDKYRVDGLNREFRTRHEAIDARLKSAAHKRRIRELRKAV